MFPFVKYLLTVLFFFSANMDAQNWGKWLACTYILHKDIKCVLTLLVLTTPGDH